MPWGWAPRHEARAQSHAEPSSTKPWKEHTAQVLQRLLTSNSGRFKADDNMDDIQKYVYLQEQVQAGVQAEAEADLVSGFRAWLQGTHAENRRTGTYQNVADGRPHRRKMDGTRYPDEETDWQSTPWGDAQLTHLPGVREWLREKAIATDKADLEMQLLAEYGPHDLESAWRYYKHWVLKRPISYPHAHAKPWDGENWHGPGMASEANPKGWAPRRSSHFDALPPPGAPPPGAPPPSPKPPDDDSAAPDYSHTYGGPDYSHTYPGGKTDHDGYAKYNGLRAAADAGDARPHLRYRARDAAAKIEEASVEEAAAAAHEAAVAEEAAVQAAAAAEYAAAERAAAIAEEAAAAAAGYTVSAEEAERRAQRDAQQRAYRAAKNRELAKMAHKLAARARQPRRSERVRQPVQRWGEWEYSSPEY